MVFEKMYERVEAAIILLGDAEVARDELSNWLLLRGFGLDSVTSSDANLPVDVKEGSIYLIKLIEDFEDEMASGVQ